MGRFPTTAHLASWAKFTPQPRQSAGKSKAATTGKGNPGWPPPWARSSPHWHAPTASSASATGTWPDAAASIARSSPWQLDPHHRLAPTRRPAGHYQDLGPDFYTSKINQRHRQRDLLHQLEHLTGKQVILQPPPEQPAA